MLGSSSVKRTTLIVMILSLAGSALGFGRETFIAYFYGASNQTDAFYVACIIPDILATSISIALTNAVIPVIKAERLVSDDSAKRLVSAVMVVAAGLLCILMGISYVGSDTLIHMFAPGFTGQKFVEAQHMFSIMVTSMVFSGLSGVLWGVHNAYDSFSFPALISIAYNIALLVVVIAFRNLLGINALAYGFVVGVVARFLIQLAPLVHFRIIGRTFSVWHRGLNGIGRAMFPIFLSAGINSFNSIVDRFFASNLAGGQITDLNFSNKIGALPANVLASAIGSVLYARLISSRLNDDVASERSVMMKGITWIVFLATMIGGLFALNSFSIVDLLFGHGAFTIRDVIDTTHPLDIYSIFLAVYLLPPLLIHFFYARSDNTTILKYSIVALLTNVLMSSLLVKHYGIAGLTFANACSQLIFVILMLRKILLTLAVSLRVFIAHVLIPAVIPGLAFLLGDCLFLIVIGHTKSEGVIVSSVRFVSGGTFGAAVFMLYVMIARHNEIGRTVRQIVVRIIATFVSRSGQFRI